MHRIRRIGSRFAVCEFRAYSTITMQRYYFDRWDNYWHNCISSTQWVHWPISIATESCNTELSMSLTEILTLLEQIGICWFRFCCWHIPAIHYQCPGYTIDLTIHTAKYHVFYAIVVLITWNLRLTYKKWMTFFIREIIIIEHTSVFNYYNFCNKII